MKDETYWASTLVPPAVLQKIAVGTSLLVDEKDFVNTHTANGRGPFGKLSQLGLLQMTQVGETLRSRLVASSDDDSSRTTIDGVDPHIFDAQRPLHPSQIRIFSTQFSRTIQSVQGLLVGLFPDGTGDENRIPIDVRHTNSYMIPDPQPRNTVEQAELERRVARSPVLLQRERDMKSLATRATAALHPLLAPDAREAAFGVEQEHPEDVSIEVEPLGWTQLAEITKCLALRDLLPAGITKQDQEAIAAHAAWRWFQVLRVPRLAHLSMHRMTAQQVSYMVQYQQEPPLIIWSGHDSTLIGLLCAYRLEQPAVWPEYASYLLLELIERVDDRQLFVRFSLNGELLKSQWEGDDDTAREMIPLDMLQEKLHSEGVVEETEVTGTTTTF